MHIMAGYCFVTASLRLARAQKIAMLAAAVDGEKAVKTAQYHISILYVWLVLKTVPW